MLKLRGSITRTIIRMPRPLTSSSLLSFRSKTCGDGLVTVVAAVEGSVSVAALVALAALVAVVMVLMEAAAASQTGSRREVWGMATPTSKEHPVQPSRAR